jgi:hypothetical protein
MVTLWGGGPMSKVPKVPQGMLWAPLTRRTASAFRSARQDARHLAGARGSLGLPVISRIPSSGAAHALQRSPVQPTA